MVNSPVHMEETRLQLEELDRIEQGIEARIHRSSQWLPRQQHFVGLSEGKKLSPRECALQRWEAAHLLESYETLADNFTEYKVSGSIPDFDEELNACMALSDTQPAIKLANLYAQHRQARGRQRFVCDKTEHVISEIDNQYPPEEQWGHILRLEPFYRALVAKNEVSTKPQGYRDYLLRFDFYADFADDSLVQYLIQFYDRAYSIGPGTHALDLPEVRQILDRTATDPLFCKACNHKLTNEAVYKAHLDGRKHKRAAAKLESPRVAYDAELVRVLARILHDAFVSTIADIDRKAGMSVKERVLEVEAIQREREREDSALSGDEEEEEQDAASREPQPTKQLLGPEGTPIPRWLYKLHGLSTVFECKICEPHAKIAGRAQFERHFRDPKHIQSLKRLGITSSDAYRGLTTVSEALELQRALQNKPNATEKEVEDEEGNVISEKMMADLKKQGLL